MMGMERYIFFQMLEFNLPTIVPSAVHSFACIYFFSLFWLVLTKTHGHMCVQCKNLIDICAWKNIWTLLFLLLLLFALRCLILLLQSCFRSVSRVPQLAYIRINVYLILHRLITLDQRFSCHVIAFVTIGLRCWCFDSIMCVCTMIWRPFFPSVNILLLCVYYYIYSATCCLKWLQSEFNNNRICPFIGSVEHAEIIIIIIILVIVLGMICPHPHNACFAGHTQKIDSTRKGGRRRMYVYGVWAISWIWQN